MVDRSEEIEIHAKAAGSISAKLSVAYASGSFGIDRLDAGELCEITSNTAGSISAKLSVAYASGSFGIDRLDWLHVIALDLCRTDMG